MQPPASGGRLEGRWKRVVWAVLRTVGSAALVVTLYYVLPLGHRSDAVTWLLVGFWAVALTGTIVWQVRAIVRSSHPGVRAVEALTFTVPVFLGLFAAAYFVMARTSGIFTEPLTRTDSLYFTVTVFSTVGFGDITAKSESARLVVTAQILADLVFIGVVIKIVLDAVQRGRERQRSNSDDAPNGSPQWPSRVPRHSVRRVLGFARLSPAWDAGRDVVGAATAQVDRSRRCRSRCSPTVRAICGSRWLSREQDWAVWRGSGLCYPLPCPTRPRGPPSRVRPVHVRAALRPFRPSWRRVSRRAVQDLNPPNPLPVRPSRRTRHPPRSKSLAPTQ